MFIYYVFYAVLFMLFVSQYDHFPFLPFLAAALALSSRQMIVSLLLNYASSVSFMPGQ
jgi:hypothetical protein